MVKRILLLLDDDSFYNLKKYKDNVENNVKKKVTWEDFISKYALGLFTNYSFLGEATTDITEAIKKIELPEFREVLKSNIKTAIHREITTFFDNLNKQAKSDI